MAITIVPDLENADIRGAPHVDRGHLDRVETDVTPVRAPAQPSCLAVEVDARRERRRREVDVISVPVDRRDLEVHQSAG